MLLEIVLDRMEALVSRVAGRRRTRSSVSYLIFSLCLPVSPVKKLKKSGKVCGIMGRSHERISSWSKDGRAESADQVGTV